MRPRFPTDARQAESRLYVDDVRPYVPGEGHPMRAKPNGRGRRRPSVVGLPDGLGAAGLRIVSAALIAAVVALGVAVGCGPDVSVDESKVGSIRLAGDDVSTPSSTFQMAEGVTFPEGFPAIGIPGDARVTKAIGSKETGNYHVIYYSRKPVEVVLQGHLDALLKLGYTDVGTSLEPSHAGEVIMSIGASDNRARSQLLIRGGGKSGSDNGYWVQINPVLGG